MSAQQMPFPARAKACSENFDFDRNSLAASLAQFSPFL
jgi:hypothetical protein